ncbi:MAG: flagellar biosynthesis anti-sigma factor FlgM [Pseudomonadota bacterium]
MITNPVGTNISVSEVSDRSDRASAEKSPAGGAESSQTVSDKVSLTLEARAIGQITESARSESDVDVEKVAALREAIANGTFEVDSRSIAEGLIRSESGVKGQP